MLAHALALFVLGAAPKSTPLPLKTLVLYENGLGYFERKGQVPKGATAEIPLEPGQLDDALKSLVVTSERGVASVEYAAPLAAEAARAMAGLPAPEEQGSLVNLIRSLQGVDVRVTSLDGKVARGRVVEVTDEQEDRDKDGKAVPTPALMLFGESGLSRVRLKGLVSLRPVDPSVQIAWDRATGSAARLPERQGLKVRGGEGGGSVAVGYTTEAPVWRTTYRLVTDPKSPRLQGWALVHNDSDEAWEGVKVTLASGRPTSFLFPLAGPRYSRRELVAPEDGLDTAPQLATAEAQQHLRGPLGSISLGSVGTVGYGSGGGGYGSGSGSITLGGRGHAAAGYGVAPSTLLEDGPTPLPAAAVSEAGELFLYTVREPVFLAARKSALLPIIDTKAGAEAVTVVDGSGTASLAVRFLNDTALTLEGGTVSIFSDHVYAGEAQLDRIKPGEVRVVRHGEDLDLELSHLPTRFSGPVKKLRKTGSAEQPMLELHRVDIRRHAIHATSRSDKPRTVLLELGNDGFRVTQGAAEDVRSPGQPRYARLTVKPKEQRDFEIEEQGSFVERVSVDSLGTARIDALISQGVPAEVKTALSALRVEAARMEDAAKQQELVLLKLKELDTDAGRVRENLAAAGKGGATKTAEHLGEQLLELEKQLAKLKTDRDALGRAKEAARKALVAKL